MTLLVSHQDPLSGPMAGPPQDDIMRFLTPSADGREVLATASYVNLTVRAGRMLGSAFEVRSSGLSPPESTRSLFRSMYVGV